MAGKLEYHYRITRGIIIIIETWKTYIARKDDLLCRILPGGRLPGFGPVGGIKGLDLDFTVSLAPQAGHLCLEMIFTAFGFDAFTDIGDDLRKTVRTDVRMGVNQDLGVGSEVHELVEDFPDISPLGRPGEQFPVRKGSGTSFSVAVIGVRVKDAFPGQPGHVELPVVYVLPTLQDYRFLPQSQQFEGREHPGRTGSDDDYGLGFRDILVFGNLIRYVRLETMVVGFYLVPVDDIVAGIYGTARYDTGRSGIRECRLIGLRRIDHVDHRVPAEVHHLCCDYPYIIQPEVTADPAGHLKFCHILILLIFNCFC